MHIPGKDQLTDCDVDTFLFRKPTPFHLESVLDVVHSIVPNDRELYLNTRPGDQSFMAIYID